MLHIIDMKIARDSKILNTSSGSALAAEVVFGERTGMETAFTATAEDPSALSTTMGAEVWHRRLGHPAKPDMCGVMNIPESGIKFVRSILSCDTCSTNKSPQRYHSKACDSTFVKERLQLVTTDLTGPVAPTALGEYTYMAKFTNHRSRLRVVHFINTKTRCFLHFASTSKARQSPSDFEYIASGRTVGVNTSRTTSVGTAKQLESSKNLLRLVHHSRAACLNARVELF